MKRLFTTGRELRLARGDRRGGPVLDRVDIVGRAASRIRPRHPTHHSWAARFWQGFTHTIRSTPDYLQQAIGYFGWFDTPLPVWTYWIFIAAFAFLVILAGTATGRRSVLVLCAVIAAALLVPALVQGYSVNQTGIIWQGRYGLFLYVGVTVVAAWLLVRDAPRVGFLAPRAAWVGSGLLAVYGVVAFGLVLVRYVIGLCAVQRDALRAPVATAAGVASARHRLRGRVARPRRPRSASPRPAARGAKTARTPRAPPPRSGMPRTTRAASTESRAPCPWLTLASRSPTTASSRSTPAAASASIDASPNCSPSGARRSTTSRADWPRMPRRGGGFDVVGVWTRRDRRRTTAHARRRAPLGFAAALFRYFVRHRRDHDLVVVAALPVLNVFAVRLALSERATVMATDWLEIWAWRKWRSYSGHPRRDASRSSCSRSAVHIGRHPDREQRVHARRLGAIGRRADPIVLGPRRPRRRRDGCLGHPCERADGALRRPAHRRQAARRVAGGARDRATRSAGPRGDRRRRRTRDRTSPARRRRPPASPTSSASSGGSTMRSSTSSSRARPCS